MAHEISTTDKTFSMRSPEWHGLAHVPDRWLTSEEARTEYLNWTVIEEPVYRRTMGISAEGELNSGFEVVPTSKLLIRSDNNAELGVVSDGYVPVQNKEMFDIMEALEKENRGDVPLKLETGGSLKGGKKVYLMIRLEDPIEIKGDPRGTTIPYYVLQNNNDGAGAFRGQATFTRVVCANTAKMADLDARSRGTEFSFRHTKNIAERISDAKVALAGWKQSITDFSEMAEHLATVRVTHDVRTDFIERFIPMPLVGGEISDRVRNNVLDARGELRALFSTETLDYTELTAWGLVQGSIEWAQHVRNTKGKDELDRLENRFSRSTLNNSDMTRNAVKIVKGLVSV